MKVRSVSKFGKRNKWGQKKFDGDFNWAIYDVNVIFQIYSWFGEI